jgi:hypothetical protein
MTAEGGRAAKCACNLPVPGHATLCPMRWYSGSHHTCCLKPRHSGEHTCNCGESPAAQPSESEREGAAGRRIQEPAGVRTACDGCSAESSDLIRISPTEGDPVHLCIGCAVQVATSVQDLVAPPSPPSTGQSREPQTEVQLIAAWADAADERDAKQERVQELEAALREIQAEADAALRIDGVSIASRMHRIQVILRRALESKP